MARSGGEVDVKEPTQTGNGVTEVGTPLLLLIAFTLPSSEII